MDPNPAAQLARKRWQGTTPEQRAQEMRRIALEGWKVRPRAKRARKRKGAG